MWRPCTIFFYLSIIYSNILDNKSKYRKNSSKYWKYFSLKVYIMILREIHTENRKIKL